MRVQRHTGTKALSDQMERELIEAYTSTKEPVTSLAKRFGCSPAVVTRTMKRWKVPLRNQRHTSWWE